MQPKQRIDRAISFIDSRKSLVLSTVNQQGDFETSVAACLFYDECFYIYVSELSQHTKNLLAACEVNGAETTKISGLLIADERDTEQMFARERMSFQFEVQEMASKPESESEANATNSDFKNIMQAFSKEFGDIVELLTSLPDFHLFQLRPIKGSYVVGFGQAFAFETLPHYGLTQVKN